ncbi:M48 family metalloprotease [Persephonella sp.]
MKKSNIVFTAFIIVVVLYFSYYYFLIKGIPIWIYDIKNCYKNMEFITFFENHINIFLYILLFLSASFFIIRTIIISIKSILNHYKLNRYLNNNTYKKFKNLYILDTDNYLAFNTGIISRKIIISKKILDKFSKEERKHVFLHEKGHLINGDSFKLFIFSILSNLFPKKIGKRLLKDFSLLKEIEADMFCISKKDRLELAGTVLRFYSNKYNTTIPMMNNYLNIRIKFLLGDLTYEELKPEKIYFSFGSLLLLFILLSYIFNYCLCSMH